MTNSPPTLDNNIDDHIDNQIRRCLNLEKPVSFFLFAGAGSGKTRSLVNSLKYLQEQYGRQLHLRGQRIGVITYTNAACDEIKQRLDFDPLIEVSTIHSYVWLLIKNFHTDIKHWLMQNLQQEIEDLNLQQKKGRAGTKATADRANSIVSKTKRLYGLTEIPHFTYNPNGDNRDRDSLNHSEVIKIGAYFLSDKPQMQNLLVSKFPMLLIDESQDTNKLLMEAFLKVQAELKKRFLLGLFGDSMQRIYGDGKIDLGKILPEDWDKPTKKMNHRCPRRIITLLNKIRSMVDNQVQIPRTDKEDGFIRLYILPNSIIEKQEAEERIAQKMAEVTGDEQWISPRESVKSLILEHHMAAKRMGFLKMFEPLYKVDKFRTSLLDGTLSCIRLFSSLILPILKAKQCNDNFSITSIVRKNSPLLQKSVLRAVGSEQINQLKKTRDAVETLTNLWSNETDPTFLEVLQSINQTGLFEIPDSLQSILIIRSDKQQELAIGRIINNDQEEESDIDEEIDALDKFLLSPFSQIEPYVSYINQKASFDTHQGVKGKEFPRVMLIIDDSEARGFLFSYEKLFGAKEKTKSDFENENSGNDTSIDRTRRLFYVACSRAEKSLAIVAYSENPKKVLEHVINQKWFEQTEVELIEY